MPKGHFLKTMNKSKIIFLAPGPSYNASSQFFQKKYESFSDFYSGYLFTVSDKAEKIQIKNIAYRSMAARKGRSNIKFVIFCLIWALKIKKKHTIDYIITYDPFMTGFIGCILKKILGAKLIVEVNGVFTSSAAWYDKTESLFGKIKHLIVPFIMRYVLSVADGVKILFPSQLDGLKNLKLKGEIVIFPNYVPINHFNNLGEKKEVLFAGFPFHIKGVDILVQSFKKIAFKFPDWNLKILGWYPDKTLLEKSIDGHPQIFHHPPVRYYEMPDHIGWCGLFVLASRTDALPRVLLEAAAAGKPRIGSKVDGVPTYIRDGVDGFLFESENVSELAGKMSILMSDSDLRKKFGSAAEERARSQFSEEKYIENYVRFIQNVSEQ